MVTIFSYFKVFYYTSVTFYVKYSNAKTYITFVDYSVLMVFLMAKISLNDLGLN
jgi:hypothetical protein